MKKLNAKNTTLLFLAAFVWGITFVFQSIAAKYMDAYSVLFLRSVIGSVTLLPFVIYSLKRDKEAGIKYKKKDLLLSGLFCGIFLTLASLFQQIGLESTSASKTGFITAVYIILVPIFGIFMKRKLHVNTLIAVIIAFVGLFFLSYNFGEKLSFNPSDFIILLGAFLFAGQILTIDHYCSKVNVLLLSMEQLIVQAVISLIAGFIIKGNTFLVSNTYNVESIISIIFIGVFSSAIAYTLQMFGQRGYDPSKASIILSMESVFSSICAVTIYTFYKFSDVDQYMTGWQIVGAVLVFSGVIISQLDFAKLIKKNKNIEESNIKIEENNIKVEENEKVES